MKALLRHNGIIFLLLLLAEVIVFKVFYPSANYAPEAYPGAPVWPSGYAWFLGLFRLFTHSETALVVFQYLALGLAGWYFFSVINLPGPGEVVLYVFLFCNPLFLFVANEINGDALFAAISLVWVTQLCRMLGRPERHHIVTQAILVGLAFSINHAALWYALAVVAAFFVAHYRTRFALYGALLCVLVVFGLKDRESYFRWRMTSAEPITFLEPRQAAGDLLSLYPHIRIDSNALGSGRVTALNSWLRRYEDTPRVTNEDSLFTRYGTELDLRYSVPDTLGVPGRYKNKVRLGSIFSGYGARLAKSHAAAFVWYCFLPESPGYFWPGLGLLSGYSWLTVFKALFLVCNIFYGGMVFWLVFTGKHRTASRQIWIVTGLLFCNFCFSVYTSPVLLSGQLFPMALEVAFGLVIWRNFLGFRGPIKANPGSTGSIWFFKPMGGR